MFWRSVGNSLSDVIGMVQVFSIFIPKIREVLHLYATDIVDATVIEIAVAKNSKFYNSFLDVVKG